MKTPALLLSISMAFSLSASAAISIVGDSTRIDQKNPGDPIRGSILIRNTGSSDCDVLVYQTDYTFDATGRRKFGKPGSLPRSNASWFTLSPGRLLIPKGGTGQVYYQGNVPAQTNLTGTYWSLVMVEPATPPAPVIKGQENKATLGLQTKIRFACKLITRIGATGEPDLQVLGKRISRTDGHRLFELDIANQGDRDADASAWVELFNTRGSSLGKFSAASERIYPNCSARYKVDLSSVPAGKYSALAVIDNGDDNPVGAQYELNLEN